MPAVPADLPAIWKFGKSITQLNGNHVPPPMHPSVTLETITAFLETLGTETIKCSPGGEWVFADGESVFRCKTSARRIADAFDGCVVGFFSADNPTAEIASGEDGHDFAIIADRFIVDYWGACATGMLDRPVFDLSDPADHHIISRLYGSKNAWRTVDGKSVRTNP